MAVTAKRAITIQFTIDIQASNTFQAVDNTASPAQIEVKQLASGANTITPPTSGVTAKAVTIIPPAGNTNSITLKGISGDTGVAIHKTDPTTIALDSPSATFVLTAGALIDGVRLIWT